MATITSQTSGSYNYNDTAAWVGGVLPDPAVDIAVVAAGCTITLSDTRTIPSTTIEGSLIQGTGVVTTLGGALTVGNGVGKDGTFTFGAGSTLAMGVNNVVYNNSLFRSNSIAVSWAFVTGSGAFVKGAVYSQPRVSWILRYVSFQTTGSLAIGTAGSSGTATPGVDVANCVMSGFTDLTIGTAGASPATANLKCNNTDIRDYTGSITLTGIDATTGAREFKHNTLSAAGAVVGIRFMSAAYDITGTTFHRINLRGATAGVSADPFTGANIFFGTNNTADNVETGLGILTVAGSTLTDSLVYIPEGSANPHVLGLADSVTIRGNVFEVSGTEPNILNSSTTAHTGTITLDKNIHIGTGSLANQVGSRTGGTLIVSNNTDYTTGNSGSTHQGLWLSENGNYAGTLIIKNNIHAVKSGISIDYSIHDNDITPQVMASDYNCFYGVTTPYYTGVANSAGTNDIIADPTFVDPTRSLLTYGSQIGVANTYEAVVGKLLTANGYNSTTKTQSDSPSGVSVVGLVTWVKAGFVPSNMTLATAGEGGTFIGAVQPVAAGDPQTITFGALPATTYGAAPFALTATASSGLSVSYASSNTAVATVSGSTVTIVGVGSTNITASQAGDETYAASTPVVQALSVSGYVITLTGTLGDVVIRATQAGNANYNAAANTDHALHVVDVIPLVKQSNTFGFNFSFRW